MKGKRSMKKIGSFLLAALLLFLAVSCGKTENETHPAGETEEISDEQAIADYIANLRNGGDEKTLYRYEDFSAFFIPGEYKNLTYPDDPMISAEITDEKIDDYLVLILLNNTVNDDAYTTLTEGKVQKFDVATIDYKGFIDGEELENGSAEGTDLLIGSDSFIDGFEAGLIGAAIGDTVKLNLHFSPYYGNEEVADKDVVFEVKIHEVKRPEIPEVTVEVINALYSSQYASLEELKEDVKADLIEEQKAQAYQYVVEYLRRQVIANSEVIELPEKERQHYFDQYLSYIQQYASYAGQSLEDYIKNNMNMTPEELENDANEYARSSVLTDLYIFTIAQKENLTWTDEQVEAMIMGAYENGSSFSSVHSMLQYYNGIYGSSYFVNNLLYQLVSQFVYEAAEMTAV